MPHSNQSPRHPDPMAGPNKGGSHGADRQTALDADVRPLCSLSCPNRNGHLLRRDSFDTQWRKCAITAARTHLKAEFRQDLALSGAPTWRGRSKCALRRRCLASSSAKHWAKCQAMVRGRSGHLPHAPIRAGGSPATSPMAAPVPVPTSHPWPRSDNEVAGPRCGTSERSATSMRTTTAWNGRADRGQDVASAKSRWVVLRPSRYLLW
jgi:hypothetical protein